MECKCMSCSSWDDINRDIKLFFSKIKAEYHLETGVLEICASYTKLYLVYLPPTHTFKN